MKAEFIKSVVNNDYTTKDNLPQIAFFGRSNAGKSSVINSLVNRKNLVKTSSVPGKTITSNFFLVNGSIYFVDFPGYGYAKRPAKERNKMIKRIFWYIENVKPKIVFLITDIRVGLTDLDLEMIKSLKENDHNIVVIANKSDKLGKLAIEKQVSLIEKEVSPVFSFSSKTKKGKEEIWEEIKKCLLIT